MNFFSLFKRKILYNLKKKINVDKDNVNFTSLDDLLHFYGSDKANDFKKKNIKGHGFSKFYSHHLKDFKNKKISILEIGSYAGASAVAFSKYFKNALIFCFDINISNFVYSSKNIYVFGIDVNNKKNVQKSLKRIKYLKNIDMFDVIIDDGSHNLSDILYNFKTFFNLVKRGGFYIVEDYKHPNYYQYNHNVNDILFDQLISNFQKKQIFKSDLINKSEQKFLMKNIKTINTYKGNLKDSDICFIEKII